jgi:excisionase family DNA binding protein
MAADSNRLMRPEELAERWGVPVSPVVRLAREGRISGAVRIGRYWRFRPAGIERFEAEGGWEVSEQGALR